VHLAPGVHLGANVTIGEETLVGIGASILPDIRIGRSCVIGAGAVVVRDVPDGETVYGVPARIR
jgi:acetyltransferase-like isoleucine patch superfamily enzyme